LVVAIVGGAIFATVQGQCAQQSSGFTGEAVTIEQFAPTDSNLQIVFRNGGSEQINVTSVAISSDSGTVQTNTTSTVMNVGDSANYVFNSITSAEACNNYDVEVTYDTGEINGASATGTISGNMAS
ncbi:MAG: hypothetical protein ABEK00_02985, partial [Candidatus Nanohaloarchaea archaeon]